MTNPAFDNCTCWCHRGMTRIIHIMPCCHPATDAEKRYVAERVGTVYPKTVKSGVTAKPPKR